MFQVKEKFIGVLSDNGVCATVGRLGQCSIEKVELICGKRTKRDANGNSILLYQWLYFRKDNFLWNPFRIFCKRDLGLKNVRLQFSFWPHMLLSWVSVRLTYGPVHHGYIKNHQMAF